MENTKNLSLTEAFENLLAIGFRENRPLKRKIDEPVQSIPWEEQFDLRGWGHWEPTPKDVMKQVRRDIEIDLVIHRNEVIERGRTQETSVRGIFKMSAGLGFASLPGVAAVFTRSMPAGEMQELPDPNSILEGAPWTLSELRYSKSSVTLNKIIALDPI